MSTPTPATRDAAPGRAAARGLRLRLLPHRPDRRARRSRLVRDLRDGHGQRSRRRARPDGGRVVAAGSRARERVALPDPARRQRSSRASRATRRPSPMRCACTAIRSRRRSTRSSGATSPACAPRATRCSSSCTSRAPACRGCCARGTRRSTTRRVGERPATSSAARPPTARGRSPSSSPCRARTSTSRRLGRLAAAPRTTWEANREGPAYLDGVRWVPILDDRERAAALERGEIDCLQNASLLDVDRLAANPDLEVIEFQQSALVYMGVDCEGARPRRPRAACDLAGDRPAGARRPRPRRARLAGGLADPVALAVVRAGGRVGSAATTRGRRPSCSTRRASHRAPTACGSSCETVVVNDATVRRVAETIREMLAAVGIRLELEVIPAFDEFYARLNEHPPAFISKWFWPEPIDAIVGFVATWGQDGGPNFQRSSDEALDRACRAWELAPRRRRAPRGRARHPAARRRVPAADPALLARGRLGAPPPRAQLAPEPPRSLSALRRRLARRRPLTKEAANVRAPGRSEAEEVVRPDLLRRHVARGGRRLPRQPRQRPGSAASPCSRRTAGRS